jgi:4-diphosphocytidyl-2-C-methyl-D-erythritol kinase
MPETSSIAVRAFAKINLTLRVLAQRQDGLHELRTVFQSLTLHDSIRVQRVPGPLRIECDDPACPNDERNLVWQAAERLWSATRRARGGPRDLVVRITKRIPMQAGLGGGSSDAAAALKALAALWRVDLPRQRAVAMSAGLGADIPFFFTGGTALGLERGDLLFPLEDIQAASVLIVVPAFGVSTAEAYRWWDEQHEGARSEPPLNRSGSSPGSWPPGEMCNDLQAPVAGRHPEIRRLVAGLRRRGATYAAMSGSGSAVFGLFPGADGAQRAATTFEGGAVQVFVARTLGRRRYERLSQPAVGSRPRR